MTSQVGIDPAAAAGDGRPAAPAVPAPTYRRGAVRFGLFATYAACVTVPWTAVGLGPLRLGDLFLLIGLVALFAADLDVRLPRFPNWALLFVVCIVAVGVLNEFFPVSTAYSDSRVFPDASGGVYRAFQSPFSNLGVMIKFLVPIVGLPLLFGFARIYDSKVLQRAGLAFAAGAAFSGLIAFTDVEGLTAVAAQVSGISVVDARGAGLTEHPNYVAMGCVFGLPFMLWQALSPIAKERAWAIAGTLALLVGLYASGSRAGGGAGAAVIVMSVVLIPRFRRVLPAALLVLAIVIGVAFVVQPGLGQAVLRALRLTGDAGEGSNIARDIINNQAKSDFFHSPIYGIGLQVASQAHIVYLQALAAGGVILLVGYAIFLLGSLQRCFLAFNKVPAAAPLFVSVLGGMIFNAAQDALTLRIVYLPSALAAVLPAGSLLRRNDDADDEPAAVSADG